MYRAERGGEGGLSLCVELLVGLGHVDEKLGGLEAGPVLVGQLLQVLAVLGRTDAVDVAEGAACEWGESDAENSRHVAIDLRALLI
jgi:hypothetical protein